MVGIGTDNVSACVDSVGHQAAERAAAKTDGTMVASKTIEMAWQQA